MGYALARGVVPTDLNQLTDSSEQSTVALPVTFTPPTSCEHHRQGRWRCVKRQIDTQRDIPVILPSGCVMGHVFEFEDSGKVS